MSILLVGLGNPGSKYELTRHNAGFLAADALIDHFDFKKKGKKFQSILYEGRIGDQNVTIMKPQTYMNDSGTAVQLFLSFFKIPVSQLIVFYDDFDIALGDIKLRFKGSGGTHNGMKDIIQKLKTTETYAMSTTGGLIEVSATKELEANSKLGGVINVHKKTDKIVESISLGGVVNYIYN